MTNLVKSMTKWQKFYLILIFIIALSTTISFMIDELFFSDREEDYQKIVLILPNDDSANNLEQSADVFVSLFNKENIDVKQKIKVEKINSTDPIDHIKKIINAKNTLGIISLNNNQPIDHVYTLAQNNNIPIITNSSLKTGTVNIKYDSDESVKFMMNYARAIIAQQDVYVLSNDSEEASRNIDSIKKIYQKDNTDKVNVIHIPHHLDETDIESLKSYFNNIDYGSVYLALNEEQSLQILPIIKSTSSVLDIFGASYFALNSIKTKLEQDGKSILNGLYTSSPILYDTANTKAQKFANSYFLKNNKTADWLSAEVYSACEILTQLDSNSESYDTILGDFDKKLTEINLPIKVGRYTGDALISTPIQLTPIESSNLDNYVLAIKENRATFINDKFMYKTNVVYTGLKLENISDLNFDNETAKIKFSIWFRYRGDFNPKDVVFKNAVEPILLSNPNSEIKKDDITYKEYVVSGVFRINFNQLRTQYDRNNIEIILQHKKFNTNNLIFVTDFLGMPKVDELQKELSDNAIITDNNAWKINDATLSQDVIMSATKGAPNYVEFQGEKPLFSQVSFVATIASTDINIREYFDKKYFIYMLILGSIAFFSAIMMDLNRWGKYWSLQAWILRFIGLPLMLLAIGNMIIDYVFIYTDLGTTNLFILLYDSLWYLLPAYLMVSAIRRFLWLPLEKRTGKKIPEIAQVFVASLIYLLSISLIVSLVFNESVTNFLAASGVFATVIGLAIHEKISDVFSGIILNIERPFSVGDIIRFGEEDALIQGVVIDIGWRGTIIRRKDGVKIIIKNSEMLNMVTENISRTKYFNHINFITAPNEVNPKDVIRIVMRTLDTNEFVLKVEKDKKSTQSFFVASMQLSSNSDSMDLSDHVEIIPPHVIFHQLQHSEDGWISEYKVSFSTRNYIDNERVMESVWVELLNADVFRS